METTYRGAVFGYFLAITVAVCVAVLVGIDWTIKKATEGVALVSEKMTLLRPVGATTPAPKAATAERPKRHKKGRLADAAIRQKVPHEEAVAS